MSILTLLRHADFVVTIAVNTAVLSFSITAYRRTALRAFALWIATCTICIVSSAALHIYGYSHRLSDADYRTFMEFYRLGFAIQAVLGGVGSIMLVKHVLANLPSTQSPELK